MTTADVKRVLKDPRKVFKLTALSYVSLTEKESDVIMLRYFSGLTQEKAAERLPTLYEKRLNISPEKAIQEYSISPNGLQKVEYRALEKCRIAWSDNTFVKDMLKKKYTEAAP